MCIQKLLLEDYNAFTSLLFSSHLEGNLDIVKYGCWCLADDYSKCSQILSTEDLVQAMNHSSLFRKLYYTSCVRKIETESLYIQESQKMFREQYNVLHFPGSEFEAIERLKQSIAMFDSCLSWFGWFQPNYARVAILDGRPVNAQELGIMTGLESNDDGLLSFNSAESWVISCKFKMKTGRKIKWSPVDDLYIASSLTPDIAKSWKDRFLKARESSKR